MTAPQDGGQDVGMEVEVGREGREVRSCRSGFVDDEYLPSNSAATLLTNPEVQQAATTRSRYDRGWEGLAGCEEVAAKA